MKRQQWHCQQQFQQQGQIGILYGTPLRQSGELVEYGKNMRINICNTCNSEFTKPHNPQRVYKFCSAKCMGSNEQKKINHSKAMKGSTAWNKGDKGLKEWMNTSGLKAGWNKGLKTNKPAWNKGIPNTGFVGEKNPNWRGGVTKENEKIRKSIEYKQWRISVFKRDNYTCQICYKKKGIILNADHIKQFALYPELRFDVDNGRTLCLECHKQTDSYLNGWFFRKKKLEVA